MPEVEFPKRDEAWKHLMALLREVPDERMAMRLMLAARDYGHFFAIEAIAHCKLVVVETLVRGLEPENERSGIA